MTWHLRITYHTLGKMGLGDVGWWGYWVDRWICCCRVWLGMVSVGYGCRHSTAVSVSESVEIQRRHACRFAIRGKTFCRRPSEICCAQFDSKAAQKVPTKMAFHRHLPVTRDAVQCWMTGLWAGLSTKVQFRLEIYPSWISTDPCFYQKSVIDEWVYYSVNK